MDRLDPFRLSPALGPATGSSDVLWLIHDLRTWREDPFAMSVLRDRLIDLWGSSGVIRRSDEQVFRDIAILVQDGWLRADVHEERTPSSTSVPEKPAPPPPPPSKPRAPAPPPPAPASLPAPTSFGPAATARLEAAKSGVPFWECCERCGF